MASARFAQRVLRPGNRSYQSEGTTRERSGSPFFRDPEKVVADHSFGGSPEFGAQVTSNLSRRADPRRETVQRDLPLHGDLFEARCRNRGRLKFVVKRRSGSCVSLRRRHRPP